MGGVDVSRLKVAGAGGAAARESDLGGPAMRTTDSAWELTILDALAPESQQLGLLATGDIDGDGRIEGVVGGEGALVWYRPETRERGVIARGHFHVGCALEDIDGDGRLEAVFGAPPPGPHPCTITSHT